MPQHSSQCPSCGEDAVGSFCSYCGEKIVSDKKELGLKFFLRDAFEEVFNVDSKFLKTIRFLLTKPGFLTNEVLAGRKVSYIKPFRLYTIIVVVHFLVFGFSGSGDIFTIEHFPLLQVAPGIQQVIDQYEVKSGLKHDEFASRLDNKIKDNLNILFYFVVFVLAFYFKLLYFRSGKYYVEHLYFLLHMISFGLLRNILLIPLFALGWFGVAFVFSMATQILYTYISLRNVYQQSASATFFKMILTLIGFLLVLIPTLLLSLAIGIFQIVP